MIIPDVGMDEMDEEFGAQPPFVGRSEDLNKLWSHWGNRYRIFGIFGLRSIGKSRLVQEFIKRLKDEYNVQYVYVIIDCRWITDIRSLYTSLCVNLCLKPNIKDLESDLWFRRLVDAIQENVNNNYLLVFDNTEDFQDNASPVRDSFLSLCVNICQRCKNARVFITSTTKVQFAQLHRVYYSHEVLPLKDADALQLLLSELKGSDIELGQYVQPIIRLTEGLPLLILMVASELKEDEGMITPEDMVELLGKSRLKTLSREFYPEEDRVASVYRKFINRLCEVYQRRLAVLEYMPGSFTAKQAQEMLECESEALVKDQILIPIRRRHHLSYDPKTRRFNIQGILRECLQTFNALSNLPAIRCRYVRTFSAVMATITQKLYTNSHIIAMTELAVEQPNLSKLLHEARYVREDTYNFFIQMATECHLLIERYMVGEADKFYDDCLRAADMYGQDLDKAKVNIAVGSLYTNVKGNLIQGARRFDDALRILLKDGRKSLQLATVYQRLGWNMLCQGRCSEAITYYDDSLSVSMTAPGLDFKVLCLSTMSSKGITLTVLGRFEEAEKYHRATLKMRRKVQGEDHPSIGATFNNIGLLYDQKGDVKKALMYFLKGLEIKKKSKAPDLSLVSSLNNIASLYCGIGKTEEAHKMIDEAEEILNRQKIRPGDPLAYMYENRGHAYMKEGKLTEARECIEIAVNDRRYISPNHPTYLESLAHMAEVCRLQKDYCACQKTVKKALKVHETAVISMPQHLFLKECLQTLVKLHEEIGDDEKCKSALGKLESELMRLEREIGELNEPKLQKIRTALEDVRSKMDILKQK